MSPKPSVNLMHRSNIKKKKNQSLHLTTSYFFKHYTGKRDFLKNRNPPNNKKRHLRTNIITD